jgi:hypothetical protein
VIVLLYIYFGPIDHGVKKGELVLVQANRDSKKENSYYKKWPV